MKGYLKRAVITILSAAMLAGCAVPALAEESKSLDDMTIEELRIAYLELQLENEKLKNELNSLKQGTDMTDSASEESADCADTAVWMDAGEFEQDIVSSYNDRAVISQMYTTDEVNSMSESEYVEYYYEAVSAEADFYNKYRNAFFDDLNIQYLCDEYTEGVGRQFDACRLYFDSYDIDSFNEEWRSGYYDRACAIVELTDCYDLDFGDITNMRRDAGGTEALDEAELANAAVDFESVLYAQQLLNEIGFYCGEADGISGERTAKSIMHFQEMFGYEPADGVIDEELLAQLEGALY